MPRDHKFLTVPEAEMADDTGRDGLQMYADVGFPQTCYVKKFPLMYVISFKCINFPQY